MSALAVQAYRGEQYDPDLGLYYLRARYYNPSTGRFLSRDPEDGQLTDPKTLYKYLYAEGDPVNLLDPTGRAAYIESILSERVVISSPLEIGVTNLGLLVARGFCGAAKVIAWTLQQGVPTGVVPAPWGQMALSLRLLAILCAATGF